MVPNLITFTEEEDWSEPEDPALHREREEEQPEGGRRHQVHPGELSAQGRGTPIIITYNCKHSNE